MNFGRRFRAPVVGSGFAAEQVALHSVICFVKCTSAVWTVMPAPRAPRTDSMTSSAKASPRFEAA